MKRRYHQLSISKKYRIPRRVVFFDSESTVDATLVHHPYLICAEFHDLQTETKTTKTYNKDGLSIFWGEIDTYTMNDNPTWLYAHNMSYDLLATGGLPHLLNLGYTVADLYEQGMTFILEMKKQSDCFSGAEIKTLCFISSTNYFPFSLKILGDFVKIKKLDYDYTLGESKEAEEYCLRDVEILREAVLKFIAFVREEKFGSLAKTTPGQAFSAFCSRFLTDKVYIHNNERAIQLERMSYYGGRVECLRIGNIEGEYYVADVSSMYPSVMANNLYPTALRRNFETSSLSTLYNILDGGDLLCAELLLSTDKPIYPCLIEKRLVFPIGDFWSFLSTPEILLAYERGDIRGIRRVSTYKGANLFTSYVNYFYAKKTEAKTAGDVLLTTFYKLMLNSLYGKFGQKFKAWNIVAKSDPAVIKVYQTHDVETDTITYNRVFGGSHFQATAEEEAWNSFPAVASHVTSYARVLLWRYIEIAGLENVLYYDTDSLFVTGKGLSLLQAASCLGDNELGKLTVEKNGSSLSIYSPKDYVIDGVTKLKGIKKDSKKIADTTFEQVNWPKMTGQLRKGNTSNYQNVLMTKNLKREYDKGWVLQGGQVKPFRMQVVAGQNRIIPWGEYGDLNQLADRAQVERINKKYKSR